uniref:Macaca fascicularis brain cDNA clone: QflA-16154, similar to human topoisomerase I binding, arginine/serine-rich (TOPORS), mRNA, RefSeq: NM_005802.2 n=1 Tax=Macaca fascicularis TaxID=9541 RepID=I7GI05_MACFA|nr:unnamed protein product [Macaca fascicularis]
MKDLCGKFKNKILLILDELSIVLVLELEILKMVAATGIFQLNFSVEIQLAFTD